MNSFTPWVEKYRPNTFNNIVLDRRGDGITLKVIYYFYYIYFYSK